MAEAEKADRIDHSGKTGQETCQHQAACLAGPRRTIAVEYHFVAPGADSRMVPSRDLPRRECRQETG